MKLRSLQKVKLIGLITERFAQRLLSENLVKCQ